MNKNFAKQDILSVLLPCTLGWASTYLAANIYKDYAFGLFVVMPFVLGATSTLILAYNRVVGRKTLRNNSYWTLFIFCLGLLAFAWEGIICMIMAFPIGMTFTYLGFLVGMMFLKNDLDSKSPTIITILFLSVPSLMAFEDNQPESNDVRFVKSSIEINASPEMVWKNVLEFPQLKDPNEFIFKTGIAYPINATIQGKGVGAVRRCNFTTGCFVEPITIWNKPNLLRFSVDDQPEPMKEMSLYDIHPTHLHGYWVSKQGQFKLTKLSNGHTLLEGTTWYVNRIKPDMYWTLWSDYIVHKIHHRVLEHIKEQAEN
jgi:hypothetical protein